MVVSITSAEDFNAIDNDLTADYVQTEDIEFTQGQLQQQGGEFTGSYDGQGNDIKGIREYGSARGMFNTLGSGATVKNMNIVSPIILDVPSGAILTEEIKGPTIDNVNIYDGYVEVEGSDAGALSESHFDAIPTIKNCDIECYIFARRHAGMIIANSQFTGSSDWNITNCDLTGTVWAFGDQGGGVLGVVRNSGNVTVNNCKTDIELYTSTSDSSLIYGGNTEPGDLTVTDSYLRVQYKFAEPVAGSAFAALNNDGNTDKCTVSNSAVSVDIENGCQGMSRCTTLDVQDSTFKIDAHGGNGNTFFSADDMTVQDVLIIYNGGGRKSNIQGFEGGLTQANVDRITIEGRIQDVGFDANHLLFNNDSTKCNDVLIDIENESDSSIGLSGSSNIYYNSDTWTPSSTNGDVIGLTEDQITGSEFSNNTDVFNFTAVTNPDEVAVPSRSNFHELSGTVTGVNDVADSFVTAESQFADKKLQQRVDSSGSFTFRIPENVDYTVSARYEDSTGEKFRSNSFPYTTPVDIT